MIEITDAVRNRDKLERIERMLVTWKIFDDDEHFEIQEKNFTARCLLAEILRIIEEGK